MLCVMKHTDQMKVNGEWQTLGLAGDTIITFDGTPRTENYTATTFDELKTIADKFSGMSNEATLFRNRPYVRAWFGFDTCMTVFPKDMKKHGDYEFRRIFEVYRPTFKWLFNNLTADDLVQYAKDRNWDNIVVMK